MCDDGGGGGGVLTLPRTPLDTRRDLGVSAD